jgi:hypothetical protein
MIPQPERIAFGRLYRTLPQPERENAKRGTSAHPWKQISSTTAHLRRDDEGSFYDAVTNTVCPATGYRFSERGKHPLMDPTGFIHGKRVISRIYNSIFWKSHVLQRQMRLQTERRHFAAGNAGTK